jgi:hypothetical protein
MILLSLLGRFERQAGGFRSNEAGAVDDAIEYSLSRREIGELLGATANDGHNIVALPQLRIAEPERLAHHALGPIPVHRFAHLPASNDGVAILGRIGLIREYAQNERSLSPGFAPGPCPLHVSVAAETLLSLEHADPFRSPSEHGPVASPC